MKLMQRLWSDDAGAIISAELILLLTVAVLGVLAGLASVRDGFTSEISDVAGAIQETSQSYTLLGVLGHSASVPGSTFQDVRDYCDPIGDPADAIDNCITIVGTAPEGTAPTAPTGGGA